LPCRGIEIICHPASGGYDLAVSVQPLQGDKASFPRKQNGEETHAHVGIIDVGRQHVTPLTDLRPKAQLTHTRVSPDNDPEKARISPARVDIEQPIGVKHRATHPAFVAAPISVDSLQQRVVVIGRSASLEIPALATGSIAFCNYRQIMNRYQRSFLLPAYECRLTRGSGGTTLRLLGATLGATRMNDLAIPRTCANNRQGRDRGHGLI
jgi:hypothetical protein